MWLDAIFKWSFSSIVPFLTQTWRDPKQSYKISQHVPPSLCLVSSLCSSHDSEVHWMLKCFHFLACIWKIFISAVHECEPNVTHQKIQIKKTSTLSVPKSNMHSIFALSHQAMFLPRRIYPREWFTKLGNSSPPALKEQKIAEIRTCKANAKLQEWIFTICF